MYPRLVYQQWYILTPWVLSAPGLPQKWFLVHFNDMVSLRWHQPSALALVWPFKLDSLTISCFHSRLVFPLLQLGNWFSLPSNLYKGEMMGPTLQGCTEKWEDTLPTTVSCRIRSEGQNQGCKSKEIGCKISETTVIGLGWCLRVL